MRDTAVIRRGCSRPLSASQGFDRLGRLGGQRGLQAGFYSCDGGIHLSGVQPHLVSEPSWLPALGTTSEGRIDAAPAKWRPPSCEFSVAISNTGRHLRTRSDTMRLRTKCVLVRKVFCLPLRQSRAVLARIWTASSGLSRCSRAPSGTGLCKSARLV